MSCMSHSWARTKVNLLGVAISLEGLGDTKNGLACQSSLILVFVLRMLTS
jgi:hypothetical protein